MKLFKAILLLVLLSFWWVDTHAQQKNTVTGRSATPDVKKTRYYYANHDDPPRAIEFGEKTIPTSAFLPVINTYFNIPKDFTFVKTESNSDKLGMHHHLMQQYYQGIPIEGMALRVHERNGFITSVNGRTVRNIVTDLNIELTETQAFQLAVDHLNSKDTVFRTGKKLIVSKDFSFARESFFLAYQFDIDVSLLERWRISVNAGNGEIINKMSLVNTCHGDPPPNPVFSSVSGTSSYYGKRDIKVELFENGYSRMMGQTESGGQIATFDFGNRHILALIFGFYEPEIFASWNNRYDHDYAKSAVSVQWGAEQVYEYYFKKHGRNSFDNIGSPVKSYVHVDQNLDNAFWTGRVLAFGDGSRNNPLVELDVVAHELTHGVTQYEASLFYSYESGALNESFSDILGKAAEFDVFGDTATWMLAKYFRDGGLRDLSNPNSKQQPDTYKGDWWFYGYEDNGGVHYNSGVQNYWFYLLSEGGSGINDHWKNYTVNSIGIDKAANITYRNLTEYLTNVSDYFDSRIGSLLATADLYGKNSTVYNEVMNAWDAVGVIDEPIIESLELYDITATTVKFKGSLLPRGDTVTYHLEYGTNESFGSSSAITKYSGKVEGILKGLKSATKYYMRLVATNENGASYFPAEFTTLTLDPLLNIRQTVDVTNSSAILYGDINPNSLPCDYYFEYGTTPALGSFTPTYLLPDTTEFLKISIPISGLIPRQTYFYKLVANNGFRTASTGQEKFYTAEKPVIISYSPSEATPGTEVTILGENFNPVAEKNQVNFGAVHAIVVNGGSTELKVKVPVGASLGPISITDRESGLNAESIIEFVPTFIGDFNKGNLQLMIGFKEFLGRNMVDDIDGDGRPDIIGNYNQGYYILQNVNQGGVISEESFVRNNFPSDDFYALDLVDIDGNGLKDIVGRSSSGLKIYLNYSTPGYIFWGVPVTVPSEFFSKAVFKDFDQDGHIDFAFSNYAGENSSQIRIFRNQTPRDSALPSFEEIYSRKTPYYIVDLISDDLDNDGSPDLIGAIATDSLFVFKNEIRNNKGFIEFFFSDSEKDYFSRYISQDFNQDGFRDLASYTYYSNVNFYLLQNLTGSGMPFAISKPTIFANDVDRAAVEPGDINGDGKIDILTGGNHGTFKIYRNKINAGENFTESSFELFEEIGLGYQEHSVDEFIVNDFNGDGRPEIVVSYYLSHFPFEGYQMEIWQNTLTSCIDLSLIDLEVSKYSANLLLPSNTSFDTYEVDFSWNGGTDWRRLYGQRISNLQAGSTYKLRIRAKCSLGFTSYRYIDFTTQCIDLNNVTITAVGINDASLNIPDASLTEVQYSLARKNSWETLGLYTNTITGLLPGTLYDVRIRGRCNSMSSHYRYLNLTTQCPNLTSINISLVEYNQAILTGMSYYPGIVKIEYSIDNIQWVATDQSGLASSLIPGTQYFVRGRLECTNTNSDFITASFLTLCPEISSLSVNTSSPFSAEVSWMDESETDRYTIKYNRSGEGRTETNQSTSRSLTLTGLVPGALYQVSVAPACKIAPAFASQTFQTDCYSPFDFTLNKVTQEEADLSWSDNIGGYPYTFDYSVAGSKTWSTIQVNDMQVTLRDLIPGTEYEARVYINCPIGKEYIYIRFQTGLYSSLSITPNPTSGMVTIYPAKKLLGHRYFILDNIGRPVVSGILEKYMLDFSTLSAGMYTVIIEGEKPVKIVRN